MKRILYLTVIVLFSCGDQKGYVSKKENNGDEVYSVHSDDKDMNRAMQKARETYSEFLKALKDSTNAKNKDFSVKLKFAYGDGEAEHMWLNDLDLMGDNLLGVLNNDPVSISRVRSGDTLLINRDSVSDWMYVKSGKLVGGYTIKALYDKMTPKEKEEFRRQVGFEIE